MKIIINETGKIETLSIIDPDTGVNYISDFIGNTGDLGTQFIYDDNRNVWTCDQETFDWWSDVVTKEQALGNRIHDLCATHDRGLVHEVVRDSSGKVDLEINAAVVNTALDEAFGAAN